MPKPPNTTAQMFSNARRLDMLIAERVMGWKRYKAIRYGEPCVVLIDDRAKLWTVYTRSQGDPGTWEETTDDVTEAGRVPAFSSNLDAAFSALERMRQVAATTVLVESMPDGWAVRLSSFTHRPSDGRSPSLALAICKAMRDVVEARRG